MANAPNKFYEFPPYRVDVQEKLLLRAGERIPLTPKAFETLRILVERHGHIVEKSELMRLVWHDAVVEENNLTQNISAIRRALGENSQDQQFIETLPRRGYRFIAAVHEIEVGEAPPPPVPAPLMEDANIPLPATNSGTKSKRVAVWVGLSVLLGAMGIGLVYSMINRREEATTFPSPTTVKLNRLAATGAAWETAISPEGDLVAYVMGSDSQQSLRVKQLTTAADTELLSRDEARFRGLTFAPDGKSLYYAQAEKHTAGHVLYQKPLQGGEAKRLLAGVDSAVTFSPDGQRIAFVRESSAGESSIVIAQADGSQERMLVTCKTPQYFAVEGPSWSPDGQWIAAARGETAPKFRFQITMINVETGQLKLLSEQQWEWAAKIAWLPKMEGLVLVGRNEQDAMQNNQLWRLDYPSGKARRLIADLNTYRGVSVNKDGTAMVTVRSEMRSDLWVVPQGGKGRAQKITTDSASQPGGDGLAWTADGRLVFTSRASGHKDLWLSQADGSQAKPLTTDRQDNVEAPTITADGQHVIFNAGRASVPRIWRIGLDGKAPLEITHGSLDLHPFSSPLEPFVYFSQEVAGQRRISRISTDGNGPPQPLTDKLSQYPNVSPDGKWIACFYQDTPTTPRRVAILPANGGPPTQLLDIPIYPLTSLRWHPDGHSLTYLTRQDSAMNLWRYPLNGGAPSQITQFQTEQIFAYAWSRDGQTLACARGTDHRDVVMIHQF